MGMKAFGANVYKFSSGLFPKYPSLSPLALRTTASTIIPNTYLACLYSYSHSIVQSNKFEEMQSVTCVRTIWTFSPLCMGRRSSKIAGRKGIQDAKKAKLYSRIGKEVVSAVKKGGPSPVSNTALAALIDKVKELDVPKEIIDRNIKRASEKGQEAYIEKIYEVYGYGGVGIIVEVLTDKINRSVARIREVVKDCGGKMADSGSIMFKFKRARVVNIKLTDVERDRILSVALDSGADDVIEPPVYEDETEEDRSERFYKIVISSENYAAIMSKLREEGITFEPDNGSELLPITPVEIREAEQMYTLEENKQFADRLAYNVLKDSPKWTVKSTNLNVTPKPSKKMRNEMGESSPSTFGTPSTPIDDEEYDASGHTPSSGKRPIGRKAAKAAQSSSSHSSSVALLAQMHVEEKEKAAFAKEYFQRKLQLKEEEIKLRRERKDTRILMMNAYDPCITAQNKAWILKKQAEVLERMN